MSTFSLNAMPEIFVSDKSISAAVSEAVARGKLRKIGSRLYTRNLDEEPEKLVRRHWYELVTGYFPDALITDRTALENQPAEDGSIFLVSEKTRQVELPGLRLRPRKGPAPLEDDHPFIGGARLASTARAYLENMRVSRARGGLISRTLSREELEERIETLLRRSGEDALNRLRDQACVIAPKLGLDREFEELSELIGTLLGTREGEIKSRVGRARAAGTPYDPDRIILFEKLFAALRDYAPTPRPTGPGNPEATANLAFFEAYFSNFIEGTEFSVEEAEGIVFDGVIPDERPDDAHDVLGTFRIVADEAEMQKPLTGFDEFVHILRQRHASIMEARRDKGPGMFKTKINQVGNTVFVAPELVLGTLERGFAFLDALGEPFQRAAFMMILVTEVHPFSDGNGRIARVMMNAELVRGGEERIIIPTSYRTDYLDALKALSHNQNFTPLFRMLDFAQRYTLTVQWDNIRVAQRTLEATGAFEEGHHARLVLS